MDLEEFLSENGIPPSPNQHEHSPHQSGLQQATSASPSVMDLSSRASTSVHPGMVSQNCMQSPVRPGKSALRTSYGFWHEPLQCKSLLLPVWLTGTLERADMIQVTHTPKNKNNSFSYCQVAPQGFLFKLCKEAVGIPRKLPIFFSSLIA